MTYRLLGLLLLLAACRGVRYRDPGDSEAMGRRIADANIASRIRVALAEDPETARERGITVRCRDGVVTLGGRIRREVARRRARRIARRCEGVREVIDLIAPTGRG